MTTNLILALSSLASAQSAGDQAVLALSQVIIDRADQMAAYTIQRNMQAQLCGGSLDIDISVNGIPESRKFYMGDDANCARDAVCRHDELFVRTCSLSSSGTQLQDPYYLRTVAQETLGALIRVAAYGLKAEHYDKAGLDHLAPFLYDALITLTKDSPRVEDLAPGTLRLADDLERGMAESILGSRRRSPESVAAYTALRAWLDEDCSLTANRSRPWCDPATGKLSQTLAPPLTPAQNNQTACTQFHSSSAVKSRKEAFEAVFGEGKVFSDAREGACTWGLGAECAGAKVYFSLFDHLSKNLCDSPDPRKDLRQFGYMRILSPYWESALAKHADPTAVASADAEFKAWFKMTDDFAASDIPAEEVSYAVRVLGTYLQARAEEPDALKVWLNLLQGDLRATSDWTQSSAWQKLLGGKALGTASRPESASVASFRDAVKGALTLPMLGVDGQSAYAVSTGGPALARLIESVSKTSPSGAGAPLQDLATFLEMLSVVVKSMPTGAAGGSGDTAVISEAISFAGRAVASAAEQDWVGFAFLLAERLEGLGGDKEVKELKQAVTFIRVVLSAYQAESVEEARAIFEAALNDVASRERRFDEPVTIDVNALVSARAGKSWLDSDPLVNGMESQGAFGGLYAPVGFQFGWFGYLGLMVYPLDLGSYLVADPSDTTPTWQDAVRAGGALYARPFKMVPIDVGAGLDYRPESLGDEQTRFFGFLALEVPLYTIH